MCICMHFTNFLCIQLDEFECNIFRYNFSTRFKNFRVKEDIVMRIFFSSDMLKNLICDCLLCVKRERSCQFKVVL